MAFFSRSLLAAAITFSSFSSYATLEKKQCDVELSHGLIITDDVIRIVDKGQTRVQINNDNQLFIRGYWVDLSPEESKVVEQFSRGIRQTVPELVDLATDGVHDRLHLCLGRRVAAIVLRAAAVVLDLSRPGVASLVETAPVVQLRCLPMRDPWTGGTCR